MIVTLSFAGAAWRADTSACVRWSTPLDPYGQQPNAFGLPRAASAPFEVGPFVGDTRRGGSVNCEVVRLAPHGNGTHTECLGHIVDARTSIADTLTAPVLVTRLVTVDTVELEASGETYGAPHAPGDRVITAAALAHAATTPPPAMGIRTRDTVPRHSRDWSGSNPPYLTTEATEWLVTNHVEHVLLDVPSIDREEDDGLLPNHHAYWRVAPGSRVATPDSRRQATITEMFDAPDSCADGLYLLFVQIPGLALDAAPSRLLACPLVPADAP